MDERRRRRSTQPDVIETEDTRTVISSYLGSEKNRTEKLQVRKFMVEPAYVRVNAGMTKNMGNYESLRVDVSVTIPCYPEEIDKVLPRVADKVAKFLDEELDKY